MGDTTYLYRAVDKEGHTIDFLLTPTHDRNAAEAFLHKAILIQGLPEKITIDKSGANTAPLRTTIRLIRQPSLYAIPSISIIVWSKTIER